MTVLERITDALEKQVALNTVLSEALEVLATSIDSLESRVKELEARVA